MGFKKKDKSPIVSDSEQELLDTSMFTKLIYKTYKFRIYPNKTQIAQLEAVLEVCCWLYNSALQERRDVYRIWKSRYQYDPGHPLPKINYFSQSPALTLIKEELSELRQVYDKILRNVLQRVDETFEAFFRRIKRGKKSGYPRYKSAKRYDSFTFPAAAPDICEGIDKAPGWKLHNNKLILSMGREGTAIGPIKIKLHRQATGKVKSLTISRNSLGEWYACFAVEQIITLDKLVSQPEQATNPVGVSLGLDKLVTLSNGQEAKNPHWLAQSRVKLTKLQRTFSKKLEAKKRSRLQSYTPEFLAKEESLRKSRRRVAKIRRHITNQRLDYYHKLSRWLVRNYDGIALPELAIAQMLQRIELQIDEEKSQEENIAIYKPNGQKVQTNFNRAISEAGWGILINCINYKAAEAGRLCLYQDPKNLAQICYRCGWQSLEEEKASKQYFRCGNCTVEIGRKWNTALNMIKKRFGANCLEGIVLNEQSLPQKTKPSTTEPTAQQITGLLREVAAITSQPVTTRASNEPTDVRLKAESSDMGAASRKINKSSDC